MKILSVTATSIQVSWWEPARANGVLQGYRIYFLQQNITSVQTVPGNKSTTVETLTRLSKFIGNWMEKDSIPEIFFQFEI